ncbi:hypothetical protein HKX48_004997 [Thoreauomyces humboldtii]|nr:hypothetical protein HKX48_004997 [Thoreauomyces humboldtii]
MDDSDKIRQKRLAKLAGSAATPTSPSASSPTSPATKLPVSPAVVAPKLPATTAPPTIEPKAKVAKLEPAQSPKASPSASVLRHVQKFLDQSDAEWENDAFEHVFQCSLNAGISEKKPYKYLEEVAKEMEAEGEPLFITTSQLERVLYARLSLPDNAAGGPLFDYLVEAWKRLSDVRNRTRSLLQNATNVPPADSARRLGTLETAQGLIINYSGLVIHPDLAASFPQPISALEEGPSCIARKLLNSNPDEAEAALPPRFLEQFMERFSEDGLSEYLEYIARSLSAHMRQQDLLKDYSTPIRVLQMLVGFKPIASGLPLLQVWNLSSPANQLELLSFLGPFFSRVSCFPDSARSTSEHYFGPGSTFGDANAQMNDGFIIGARNAGNVMSAQESLRGILTSYQSRLHGIVMSIVKSGPEGREGVLSYFSRVLNANSARGKMQVDKREVSTDGFMDNLMKVSLLLAEPFMDIKYSKLHLIDPDFFNYSNRLDITEQTRINADKDHYEAYLQQWKERNPNPPPAHFVSDVFFLTLGFHHYGLISMFQSYKQLIKHIDRLREHVEKLKADRDAADPNPSTRLMSESMIKRFQTELDKHIGDKLAIDTALRSRPALETSFRFYDLVMMWLLRCAVLDQTSVRHPAAKAGDTIDWGRVARGDTQDLPLASLPATPPLAFTILPEWIIEDICDLYLAATRYEAPMFEHMPRNAFLTFSMTFLANPHYIKNPHLKSKLVEILYTFTWPLWRTADGQSKGSLDGVFCTHPLAKELLVGNLMRFYVEAEHTGASSQFYDKFNIRYHISQILKSIWNDAGHRSKVVAESRNTEFFVKFAALLMNDATFLLDESLTKFKLIQGLQIELADPLPPTATAEEQTARDERVSHLETLEKQAGSYMSLGNETVHMLQYMTASPDIVQPFMEPEIVERLAAMLDYNLAAMVGPKCTDLKVKDPEKYRFRPKRLLTELVEIYMHLAHRDEFVAAVAKDERSYRKDLFVRAKGVLLRNNLKNSNELRVVDRFVDDVEAAIKATAVEEEELGDVPDEFLDPLLFHIMDDPVVLPTSGLSIDRSTVKSHLLSDAHDPFNRQPLTIEQVVPDDALRNKIQEWKRSRRASGAAASVAANDQQQPAPMDLS